MCHSLDELCTVTMDVRAQEPCWAQISARVKLTHSGSMQKLMSGEFGFLPAASQTPPFLSVCLPKRSQSQSQSLLFRPNLSIPSLLMFVTSLSAGGPNCKMRICALCDRNRITNDFFYDYCSFFFFRQT